MENRYPGVKQTIGLLLLTLFLQVVFSALFTLMFNVLNIPVDSVFITGLANLIALGIIIFRSVKRLDGDFKNSYALNSFNWKYIIVGIVFAVGISIIISEIDNLTRVILPMPQFVQTIYNSMVHAEVNIWTSVFTLCIVAPVTEELLFRGLILQGFLSSMSKHKAVFLSALFFALFHVSPWQFIGPFIIGVVFAYLFIETKSVFPSMILHGIFNLLPILVVSILKINIPGYSTDMSQIAFQPLWFDLVGIILVTLSAGVYYKGSFQK